jgi:hypothetical protein
MIVKLVLLHFTCFHFLISLPIDKALRRLKLEVKTQKEETVLLRKALQDCEACKVIQTIPSFDPNQTKPARIMKKKGGKSEYIFLHKNSTGY